MTGPVRRTLLEHEVEIVGEELLTLAKGLTVTRTVQVGSTIEVDMKLRFGARANEVDVTRAIVDVLTRDYAGRYADGFNIEEQRYEPGSSEWIGWVVGNADRIEVREGMMLRDVTSEERREWVARVLRTNQTVKVKR